MEVLLFIGIIAAAFFAYSAGTKEGERQLLKKLEQAAHSGMNPESAFARTYGRPGFYFESLHSDLNAGALAVTSSASFLKLVAKGRLGNESSTEDVNAAAGQLADAYHLENGWTPLETGGHQGNFKATPPTRRVKPKPSLKPSANGRPPGPVWRYAVHFRQPGPGVLQSSPA